MLDWHGYVFITLILIAVFFHKEPVLEQQEQDHGQRAHILIVDDDANGLRLLHSILEEVGDIIFAKSGEAALGKVAERRPDVILLDAEMPGLGGYATCAALKADSETADIPIVFVTSHADTDSETRALTIGAVDFIHKPINPPVVVARVKTQLALKQKTDALRRLTNVDALTGISNRRAFDEALLIEWRRSMRTQMSLCLLMLDVDHFKRYNDTYGHPMGDTCLRQVAQSLAAGTKRAGDVVARYGGEEFAVILPHTSAADAQAFGERLCASIRELSLPHCDSPVAPIVTISVGVACLYTPCAGNEAIPGPCTTCSLKPSCVGAPDALLRLADQALYQAKKSGRNQAVCLTGTPDPALIETDLSPPTVQVFPR